MIPTGNPMNAHSTSAVSTIDSVVMASAHAPIEPIRTKAPTDQHAPRNPTLCQPIKPASASPTSGGMARSPSSNSRNSH